MKKLVSICFLLFFVVTGNAQEIKKSKWSELNQDQLNLALERSIKTIKTGKILTFSGLGFAFIGSMIAWSGQGRHDDNTTLDGSNAAVAGVIMGYTGITVWIVGASKKKNIQLELAKFKTNGSASINGVGLKVRF
jgi:hypothetical protein